MSYIGKILRQKRFYFPNENFGTIIPIDHGLTFGPMAGIETDREIGQWISNQNISAVILHRGLLEKLAVNNALNSTTGIILHLNGMSCVSTDLDTKELLTSVDHAQALGADGISFQVNFTELNTSHNLKLIAQLTEQAHRRGLPVLAMLYDKVDVPKEEKLPRMRSIMRAAVELGCDALKVAFPSSIIEIESLMAGFNDKPQVFFAGGDLTSEQDFINKTIAGVSCGAGGLCVGRNVFQNPNKDVFLQKLRFNMEKCAESASRENSMETLPA
ncbi:class I fructose-bisphosphate aldolase [Sessilibacter corallicola]|uniref:2-amino-3,7-dideoxy-D-threo-hept-6-ulosonate synthase n=1 Tax=Sessilibacter corallicola TaxID=2904075 RepID=A0ABQ0AB97_9GAMM|nr:hypothetical protein [Sessilibacter corallicola]MCE2028108.1 hypothetical protein [Sessilibacter corallicola]